MILICVFLRCAEELLAILTDEFPRQAETGISAKRLPTRDTLQGIMDKLALPKEAKKKRTHKTAAGGSRKRRRTEDDASISDERFLSKEAFLVEEDDAGKKPIDVISDDSQAEEGVGDDAEEEEEDEEDSCPLQPRRRSCRTKRALAVSTTSESSDAPSSHPPAGEEVPVAPGGTSGQGAEEKDKGKEKEANSEGCPSAGGPSLGNLSSLIFSM